MNTGRVTIATDRNSQIKIRIKLFQAFINSRIFSKQFDFNNLMFSTSMLLKRCAAAQWCAVKIFKKLH